MAALMAWLTFTELNGMNIIKCEPPLSLLQYTAYDYRYKLVFVVCYGLQVTQHETQEEADKQYTQCRRHSLKCNRGA